MTFCWFL